MRYLKFLALASIFLFNQLYAASSKEIESAKKQMIQESVTFYSGNCPCPYNVMRNGRSCGKRSAYSRPGGAVPLCYASDISDIEAEKFLRQMRER